MQHLNFRELAAKLGVDGQLETLNGWMLASVRCVAHARGSARVVLDVASGRS